MPETGYLPALRPGQGILDLGCGTGTLALIVKKIEPAPELLSRARDALLPPSDRRRQAADDRRDRPRPEAGRRAPRRRLGAPAGSAHARRLVADPPPRRPRADEGGDRRRPARPIRGRRTG